MSLRAEATYRGFSLMKKTVNKDHSMNHRITKPTLFLLLAAASILPSPRAAGAPPYPPSPVIREVRWAPPESILRDALDSDNWPMTWGDDDALYTAYGDGTGFKPKIKEKLSLGIARVTGAPPRFQGENIRSNAEAKGNGKNGPKASGMLMVDGTLYMLARNLGNARLAWSADRGKTWTWADWRFTESFGCPTFLNYGKNYAGARDRFVYIYSNDRDDAYTPGDRYVMARVPQERIRELSAYEYFQKLNPDGPPVWTKNIKERGAVFTAPGWCYRSLISYDAGLKRYLWCQVLPDGGRIGANPKAGALGVFDAPEPWGPWTTACHSTHWEVNPGDTAGFPTKWMSPDGRRLQLVFSGEDSMSVRAAELILTKP